MSYSTIEVTTMLVNHLKGIKCFFFYICLGCWYLWLGEWWEYLEEGCAKEWLFPIDGGSAEDVAGAQV